MTGQELLDYTRNHVLRDTSVPPLFDDTVLCLGLSEAVAKLATAAHMFIDDDVELEIDSGDITYALNANVKMVYSVRLDGFTGYLGADTENRMPSPGPSSKPSRYCLNRRAGKVASIRFDVTPDQDYLAVLNVARLPAAITVDNLEDDIEVPDEYQLVLADWASFRCLTGDDVDGRNDKAADKAEARFVKGVNEVKRNLYRLRMGNNARAHGDRVK